MSRSDSLTRTPLRRRLLGGEHLCAPTVYDGLTARMAAAIGFEIISVGGFGVAATHGLPDLGLLTMTELVEAVTRCSIASGLPIAVDADTGFGGPLNIRRTVRELERAGSVALAIEDQVFPKSCPFLQRNELVSPREGAERVAAAREACENGETLVIARTDTLDLHDAIIRGKLYANAGADALFVLPGCVPTATEARRLAEETRLPLSLAFFREHRSVQPAELQGVCGLLSVFPFSGLLAATAAIRSNLVAIKAGVAAEQLPAPQSDIAQVAELLMGDVSSGRAPMP